MDSDMEYFYDEFIDTSSWDEEDEYEEDPEPMSDEGIQVRCHCLKLTVFLLQSR